MVIGEERMRLLVSDLVEFTEEIFSEDKGNPEDAEGKAHLPTKILL